MVIGRLKASPDDLVLVIGKQLVEMAADYCTPPRREFPTEGASWRRSYLMQHPGTLQSLGSAYPRECGVIHGWAEKQHFFL
jgi:hypothetical protein